MSEDIDINVVLEPTAVPLKGAAGNRLRLKELHENIAALLNSLGFPLLAYREGTIGGSISDGQLRFLGIDLVGQGTRDSEFNLGADAPLA